MAILMRCVTPFHAGDRYIAIGTILPPNDPATKAAQFFEPYEVADPAPKKTIRSSRKAAK